MSPSSSACLCTFINSSLVKSYLEQYGHIVPQLTEFRSIHLSIFFLSLFAGEVKKGIPTDDEVEDLSEKIPDHWKKLGRRLTFDKAELEGFDKDNDKIADKAYAMLMAWNQREGSAATYRVLNKALCHIRVKRRDLAQRFCCN